MIVSPIGKLFVNPVIATGGGVSLLIPQVNNPSGIIIRTLQVLVTAAGSAYIFADVAAPSSGTDLTKRIIFAESGAANTQGILPYPIFVPGGVGIWLGANASAQAYMTYDLVDANV